MTNRSQWNPQRRSKSLTSNLQQDQFNYFSTTTGSADLMDLPVTMSFGNASNSYTASSVLNN